MSKYDNNIDYRNSKPVVVDIDLYNEMKHKADKYDEIVKSRYEELGTARPNTEDIILYNQRRFDEALKRIEKLEQENERIKNNVEWCDGCKEYDNENHCCPRFSHFIKRIDNECKSEIVEEQEE